LEAFSSPPPSGGGEPPLPPEGGEAPPPPAGGEVTPESKVANMNILLENNFGESSRFLNLSQGQDSLGEISKELDKLLNS
jgi:hypothetical protein